MLHRVQAIFDLERSESVPLETRIAAGDAMGQAGDTRLDLRRSDYWAKLPAGQFFMGGQSGDRGKPNFDPDAEVYESPVHEVYLDAFSVAPYPVTVGQYQQFVDDEGYTDQRFWNAGGVGQFDAPAGWDKQTPYPARPIVGVSWYEASAFCAWAGLRLLTEAEWERAARGTDGRKFPWGPEPADRSRLNFAPDFKPNLGYTTPVGVYPLGATPEGIFDLAGNVWEWCADWYGAYPSKFVSNPRGAETATLRVIRGGSWLDDAGHCRAANRHWVVPQRRWCSRGFRVAAVPSGRRGGPGRAKGQEEI